MRKTYKILTAVLMMMAMVLTVICQPVEAYAKTTKKPVVKASKTVITKGEKTQLKATVNKKSVTGKVTWKSSNKKVATVSKKGVVTGKKVGKTYITATYQGKTSKKVKITVKQKSAADTSGNTAENTTESTQAPTTETSAVTPNTTEEPAQPATTEHTHDYQPVYKTEYHPATGHYETVDVETWEEQVTVTENVQMCNTCKKTFGPTEYGSPDDAIDALAIHQWEESPSTTLH